jgi:hypothetical protein
MKPVFLRTAALILLTALSHAPASAENAKPACTTSSANPECPATTSSAGAPAAPHWEYRYGYDRRAAWRGHWVLVR